MARKENIVSYTAEEIAAMVARGEHKTDWARANAKTEDQLAADTASDSAWDGVPDDWHNEAVARTGPLFRPKENKQPVHIRFDADVVAFFKRGGRGWQGRMNAVCAASWNDGVDQAIVEIVPRRRSAVGGAGPEWGPRRA